MPRKICQSCQRPPTVCYCSALVQVTNIINVLIIQHPLEQKHPFNTGHMAHLCLTHSKLIVAEIFTESELDKLLSIPSALLYPSLDWLPETVEINPCDKTNSDTQAGQNQKYKNPSANVQQLIVIDANWNKSKKILHLNPQLQQLPRLNLTGDLQSHYQIRKTSIKNGLSTIESIVKAMQQLEPKGDFQLMLKPFERMIALQNNYNDKKFG